MPTAVIDLGSNSTRLLIADLGEPARPRQLERRATVTGLARGVGSSGPLSSEAIEAVCEVVSGYLDLAAGHDAEPVLAIATSAVRDASNGGAFIAELRERFGLEARLLDGLTEARLTCEGAMSGRELSGPTLVFDIGGGSTELVIAEAGEDQSSTEIVFRDSLQLGVVRHSERCLRSDPPGAEEVEVLADSVGEQLAAARASYGGATPVHAIAVAGTPLSMATIELGYDADDADLAERVEGHVVTIEFLQHQLGRLASLPLAQRRQVRGLDPGRAATIVAGIVILIATMRTFGLDRVEASGNDIMLGAALEAARHS